MIEDPHRKQTGWAIGPGPSRTPQSSKSSGRKVNKHGAVVLKNGVIALRDLELSESVPPKKHNPEAEPLFGQLLSWGQAYTLFAMVMCAIVRQGHWGAASMQTCRTVLTGPNLNSTQNDDPVD